MLINKQASVLHLLLGFVFAMAAAPSHAIIFEDFLFDDPAGTAIENAVNDANPGNFLDFDADNAGVVTNGSGQLNASLKSNTLFGTNYVDSAAISTGKVFGVMELTWDFQSTLDPAENEQIRVSLINQDPRNTEITAELRIERDDNDNIVVNGQTGGTGATDLPNVTINGGSLTQSQKFIGVVAADLDADTYEILYSSDEGATFLSAGTGLIDPNRIVETMRLTLNNDLSNDNVLIDRFYLTDVSPITSVDALTLEVNSVTGEIIIKNESATPFDINSYRIESPDPDSDLNFASWSSLSDNSVDAIDGSVDVDMIVGNGIGETWDEAAGSDDDVLAESFLLGSSVFGMGRSESLGNAFQIGGAETLEFQYRDAVSGAISDGNVVYVSTGPDGDFDDDGDVDGADFLEWQRSDGTSVGLTAWQNGYGAAGSPLDGVAAVPEPSTFYLGVMLVAATISRAWNQRNW